MWGIELICKLKRKAEATLKSHYKRSYAQLKQMQQVLLESNINANYQV